MNFPGWLEATQASIALRESLLAYPLVETAHVLALALFAGLAILTDLRLLGFAFRDVPASELLRRLRPWVAAGFAIMLATGALLFMANPLRTFHSVWFRAKMLFLFAAALNIAWFHFRTEPGIKTWDLAPWPPRAARWAGVISLAAWLGMIVAGRLIAYDWFDCNRHPTAWIAWIAQCPRIGD